ncbi:MAG: hypothetical protein M3Q71_12790 [Chloroflexota bacterium]|nr:hypothetical protein [Chloroflexota bacterium]
MFGRAFTELFGALLLTRGFGAVIGVLAFVGFLIQNPAVAIGLAVVLVAVVGAVLIPQHRAEQRLPVNGVPVHVREFACPGCGLLGKLRVVKRTGR